MENRMGNRMGNRRMGCTYLSPPREEDNADNVDRRLLGDWPLGEWLLVFMAAFVPFVPFVAFVAFVPFVVFFGLFFELLGLLALWSSPHTATVQSSDPVTNTPDTVVPPTCTVPPLWAMQVTVPWW